MLKPKQWERRAPGKKRADVVLQRTELARTLGCRSVISSDCHRVEGALPVGSVRRLMDVKGGHDLLTTFLESTRS